MPKNIIPLPNIDTKSVPFPHFPTKMQAVIFKNWDIVSKERIAKCLNCSVEDVVRQASLMGLTPQKDVSVWAEKGYISIIKNNWQLLPYDQLLTLLDWDEQQLAVILKEEDFLGDKLCGPCNLKPACEPVAYRELTKEEEAETTLIYQTVTALFHEHEYDKEPFDFFASTEEASVVTKPASPGDTVIDEGWFVENNTCDDAVNDMADRFLEHIRSTWGVSLCGNQKKIRLVISSDCPKDEYHEIEIKESEIILTAGDCYGILRGLYYLEDMMLRAGGPHLAKGLVKRTPQFKSRIIYSYCGLYQTALDTDGEISCPDSLLERYARVGVNGIWLQGVLSQLTEFPFAPELSAGWQTRLANLETLVDRAKKYGIKIYLYINEPRGMPLSFFEKFPHIKGTEGNLWKKGIAALCTSTPKVQDYLRNAISAICDRVPDLGGFFTITCSENTCNCYSHAPAEDICPRCGKKKHYEVFAECNRIVTETVHASHPDMKVIAWDWAWAREDYLKIDDLKKCIYLHPEDTILMCARENGVETNVGGVSGQVDEYSLSVCGISDMTRSEWEWAKESGHETAAKVQINNTWECSTIPYLPVFSLLEQNIRLLKEEKVSHLLLSWTLGGYPSPNIRLISDMFFEEEGVGEKKDMLYTMYGKDAETIRTATDLFSRAFQEYPFCQQTVYRGPANGGAANLLYGMPTGFEATMTGFTYDDLTMWRGIYPEDIFENQFRLACEKWAEGLHVLESVENDELKVMAESTYIQLKAAHNQIGFIRARNQGDNEKMLSLIQEEQKLAARLHEIMQQYPTVGFEAANHYYYTQGMLKEKAVNCAYWYRYFSKK